MARGISPSANKQGTLGTTSKKWQALYVDTVKADGSVDAATVNATTVNATNVTATGTVQGGKLKSTGDIEGVNVKASGNITATGTVQGGKVKSTGAIEGASLTTTGAVTAGSITASTITSAGSGGGAVNINAATAVKATQDAQGNTIHTTYLKLAGGTTTGLVKAQGGLNASGGLTIPTTKGNGNIWIA